MKRKKKIVTKNRLEREMISDLKDILQLPEKYQLQLLEMMCKFILDEFTKFEVFQILEKTTIEMYKKLHG